jgi:hypothetical protein
MILRKTILLPARVSLSEAICPDCRFLHARKSDPSKYLTVSGRVPRGHPGASPGRLSENNFYVFQFFPAPKTKKRGKKFLVFPAYYLGFRHISPATSIQASSACIDRTGAASAQPPLPPPGSV